jgi:hypothetical protein
MSDASERARIVRPAAVGDMREALAIVRTVPTDTPDERERQALRKCVKHGPKALLTALLCCAINMAVFPHTHGVNFDTVFGIGLGLVFGAIGFGMLPINAGAKRLEQLDIAQALREDPDLLEEARQRVEWDDKKFATAKTT